MLTRRSLDKLVIDDAGQELNIRIRLFAKTFANSINSVIQTLRYGLQDLIEQMLIFGETKGRKCQTYYLQMDLAVQTLEALLHLRRLLHQSPLKVDQAVGTKTSRS